MSKRKNTNALILEELRKNTSMLEEILSVLKPKEVCMDDNEKCINALIKVNELRLKHFTMLDDLEKLKQEKKSNIVLEEQRIISFVLKTINELKTLDGCSDTDYVDLFCYEKGSVIECSKHK
jgi:hypothetical protein